MFTNDKTQEKDSTKIEQKMENFNPKSAGNLF